MQTLVFNVADTSWKTTNKQRKTLKVIVDS